ERRRGFMRPAAFSEPQRFGTRFERTPNRSNDCVDRSGCDPHRRQPRTAEPAYVRCGRLQDALPRSRSARATVVLFQALREPVARCRPPPACVSEDHMSILDRIGNTSLLTLRKVGLDNGARILVKLESENPTGSIKDRMALAMIEAAEANGRLACGGSVVEYTGGSTGVSLSLICTVKGHPLHIVTSDAFAREKLDHMKILGATLQIVKSESGRMTEKLTRDMIEAARVTAVETGGFWTDQLNNKDQLAAYYKMAEEIWIQTDGQIDGFVQS